MKENNNEESLFRSFLGREFDQKVKQQKDNNDKQAQNDVESGSKISQVYHSSSNHSSTLIAITMHTIQNTVLNVNTNGWRSVGKSSSNPAAILVNKADIIRSIERISNDTWLSIEE